MSRAARFSRLAPVALAGGALIAAGLWLAAKQPSGERTAREGKPATAAADAALAPPPSAPAMAVPAASGVEPARRRLERRLAALETALRPFPAEVPLRTLFRRAQIELRLAAAAERQGKARAALAALSRAAADITAAEQQVAARTARLRDPGVRLLWQRWADAAVAASHAAGAAAVVEKLGHRCVLFERGRAVASFAVDLGRNPVDDKLHAGDAATPEGVYHVVEKKAAGATRFHRALLLDYPGPEDRREFAAARRAGLVPRGRGIGGLIEIHGHGGRGSDWTNGCVAPSHVDSSLLVSPADGSSHAAPSKISTSQNVACSTERLSNAG